MKYDLHCHSNYSDGQLSPDELIALAAKVGITHLSLTDHDTLAGLQKAHAAAQQHGIKFTNGVELSCQWNGQLLHVVGLGFDENNTALVDGIKSNIERRMIRSEAMIEDFLEHKIDLKSELDGLLNGAVPTRPHFAQALINLGLAKNKQQAFKRYLVRGKPGFIPQQWPGIEEIGAWISNAGGVAVLAHPLRYKFTRTKLVRLIEEMKTVGINAIEVCTANTDTQQSAMLAELTRQYGLFASTGSDFHAYDQPWARLGSASDLPDNVEPVWQQVQFN